MNTCKVFLQCEISERCSFALQAVKRSFHNQSTYARSHHCVFSSVIENNPDVENSFHTKNTCEASLPYELSCGSSGFVP